MPRILAPLVLVCAVALPAAAAFADDGKAPAAEAEANDKAASEVKSKGGVVVEKLPRLTPKQPTPKAKPSTDTKVAAVSKVCEAKYAKEGVTAVAADDGEEDLQAQVKKAVAGGNVLWALLLIFAAGFLTALSPCVYPLIPITLSIFGARQASSKLQGFLLSSAYVGGMVILYTTLGTTFAAFGFLAGSALQSPIITIGVAVFCVVMATSMFGAFDFALPHSLQQKLNTVGGAGYKGAFFMGLVAGIIAAPCTGPVLSFILTLIAKNGDVAKGALYMLVYALGMGLPFLVLGTFSTFISRIPKSGNWMEAVKSVFGILMLVAGLYYLQFGITAVSGFYEKLATYGLVVGGIAVVGGVAIGALHLTFKYSSPVEKLRKGGGVVLTTFGLLTTIAFFANSKAEVPEPKAGEKAVHVAFTKIGSEAGGIAKFDALLAKAKETCTPVMVDFYADWCAACKELDKLTYPDEKVAKESERFLNIKIDATSEGEAPDGLQEKYGIVGLPTVLFFDGSGNLKSSPRVTGFVTADKYLPLMQKVR